MTLRLLPILLCLSWLACADDPLAVERHTTDAEIFPTDNLEARQLTNDGGPHRLAAGDRLILDGAGGPLTLALRYRLEEPGTRARLLLGGNYPLELPSMALDSAAGTIDAPTPGVWQDLELSYLPGGVESPPLLTAAYLNGNLVHYQQALATAGSQSTDPLIAVEEGSLSVTDLRTRDRAGKSSTIGSTGKVMLNIPLLEYAYYDVGDRPERFTEYGRREPDKRGYIERFDLEAIRNQRNGYALRFDGTLDIPRAGAYTFRLETPSDTRLYIDGQLVVERQGRQNTEWSKEESIELSEGSHNFRLDHYHREAWNFLRVEYVAPDGSEGDLNGFPEGVAIARPPTGEPLAVETGTEPYMLRSFLTFPPARAYQPASKRTHVVNVGHPAGIHYSYDLQRGSLLQAWRGKFVDVSDMWVGRGQAQTARPLGTPIVFGGESQWNAATADWPDSLAGLRHRRYELDDAGLPTFHYELNGEPVTDHIAPTSGGGLERTLTNSGAGECFTVLASARRIAETAPGNFELSGPGANLSVIELASGGLHLVEGPGGQRLLAELPPGEHITYTLNW